MLLNLRIILMETRYWMLNFSCWVVILSDRRDIWKGFQIFYLNLVAWHQVVTFSWRFLVFISTLNSSCLISSNKYSLLKYKIQILSIMRILIHKMRPMFNWFQYNLVCRINSSTSNKVWWNIYVACIQRNCDKSSWANRKKFINWVTTLLIKNWTSFDCWKLFTKSEQAFPCWLVTMKRYWQNAKRCTLKEQLL